MEFTDTHAHLDAFASPEDLRGALLRAKDAGVTKIIACSARRPDWDLYPKIAGENPASVLWQIGLHPTELESFPLSVLDEMDAYLKLPNPPVSVGEIGLDFYRMEGSPEEIERAKSRQREFFEAQIHFAKAKGLPICVHARCAVKESIDAIDRSGFDWSKAVFHCFGGGAKEVMQINERGGRASFTGIITFKNAGEMRGAMLAQGLSKIMFETDCPYLSPAPFRGEKNEPSRVPLIAAKAAELFGVSLGEIARISRKNSDEFFEPQKSFA